MIFFTFIFIFIPFLILVSSFSDTKSQKNVPQPLESIRNCTGDYKKGPSTEFLLLERKYMLPDVLPAQLHHLPETAQTVKPRDAFCVQ